ncbi:MAG: SAM-dependent methyltransferase [Chitinophagales bacterium]
MRSFFMKDTATLYLIPCTLGDNTDSIAPYVRDICQTLDCFVVENLRSARRYLRKIGFDKNFDEEVRFYELDKHKLNIEELFDFLQSNFFNQKNIGLLSEAGNPCIADPGALVVELTHQLKINVKPLVGPSSILLALIASGFNGQEFSFHGYLPIDADKRSKKIKQLESEAKKRGSTQIFMETPYRNNKLIASLIKILRPDTMLSIAVDLTLDTEYIATKKIATWQKEKIDIHKRPAIFVIGG